VIDPNDLRDLVEAYPQLVRAKRSERYPELRVLKYKPVVHYDNLWDRHPLLVECRGLVVDDDYNVVVKPFTKIFNYGENGTKIDRDEEVIAVRKINGFLGVGTVWKGRLIVSTTGTLDSDYARLAEKWISRFEQQIKDAGEGLSFAFEIVDKSDPHIIAEEEGAYLIGAHFGDGVKASERDLDYEFSVYGIGDSRVNWEVMRFSDVVKLAKTVKHEGFVVYGKNTTLKIKSPYYTTAKLFARMKQEKLERILRGQEKIRGVDEDYLPVVEHLRKNADEFLGLCEQDKVKYVREFIEKGVLV
jgi:hypothetical protein